MTTRGGVAVRLGVPVLLAAVLAACGQRDDAARTPAALGPTTRPAVPGEPSPRVDTALSRETPAAPPTTAETSPAAASPPRAATGAVHEPVTLPDDAASLAAQLVRAEETIRSSAAAADVASAALIQQATYRHLGEHPEQVASVLQHVPPDLHLAVGRNADAAAQLRALVRPVAELPAWRIVAPAPADELLAFYREAEADYGVAWPYLAAIHLVETRMGRIRGTSTAGAQGPMQFMPPTWDAYGEGDVNDNRDAIRAAARYLRAHGAPGDMDRALFAYNHSSRYVRAVRAYADVMTADARAYPGYYHWQVYFRTPARDVLLPVGYGT